jgi:hypothetical protein
VMFNIVVTIFAGIGVVVVGIILGILVVGLLMSLIGKKGRWNIPL